jgi:hypothetical protein
MSIQSVSAPEYQTLSAGQFCCRSPFVLVAILIVASDKKLMQGQPSSRLGWAVVAITTVAMFAAGVAMFVV